MRVLVTGGAGFIGSAVCRHLALDLGHEILVIDKLTYAGNLASLSSLNDNPLFHFERADICEAEPLAAQFASFRPDAVIHLAAESHVDRSICGARAFLDTNVVGTFNLLEASRAYLDGPGRGVADGFRLVHVSTDEVFGSLGTDGLFTESTAYDPSSPYSATKAASDHLARAWHRTYGLPVIVSNCSNNYGPRQFPEKLIPLMILAALEGRPLPVYGDGANVRDWLYVEDHARALALLLERGQPGETYNVGGRNERRNIDVVGRLCELMDRCNPAGQPHDRLVTYVADRPGHDHRYAIDATKLETELGWRAQETFETGLAKTVDWYLANRDWWQPLRDRVYGGERLGLISRLSALRIFVVGREGQIARSLRGAAATSTDIVLGHGARPELDLMRPETILPAMAAFSPDIVVNAAAYTAVDRAESDAETAFAVNRDGAGAVAVAADKLGAPVIHLSTDYVFDGAKTSPYLEADPTNPLSVYGRSKLGGEAAVASAASRHVVLRTSWVYAPFGANFVRTMLRLASERDRLTVVDDQTGCPTYAPDIAGAILTIGRRLASGWREDYAGVTHIAGPDALTWCGFARKIVAMAADRGARRTPVDAIATADYPTPAARPANSRLATERLAAVFGVRPPPLDASLTDCLERLHVAAGNAP